MIGNFITAAVLYYFGFSLLAAAIVIWTLLNIIYNMMYKNKKKSDE
jgi:hypothetical protein